MKKQVKYLVLLALIPCFRSQTANIDGTWFCKDINTCLVLDKDGYSYFESEQKLTYKVRNDRLKLTYHYRPRSLIGGKVSCWFNIEKLTKDTLIIRHDCGRNNMMEFKDSVSYVFTSAGTCP